MQLLDLSFLTFFVAGGASFVWFVIIGAILILLIPSKVRQFAFTSEHYSEVELALVSGFHFGALVHGVGLISAIAIPFLARKRGFSDIHKVCSGLFIAICRFYIIVLFTLTVTTVVSMVIWMIIT